MKLKRVLLFVGSMSLLSLVLVFSVISSERNGTTFYITAPWAPGKVIKVNAKDRLDAITSVSITVWNEKEWQEASKIPGMPKADEIDWRR